MPYHFAYFMRDLCIAQDALRASLGRFATIIRIVNCGMFVSLSGSSHSYELRSLALICAVNAAG